MATWDSQTAKAQIRLTSQRLAQIQQRIDQEAKIKRRDISSVLQSNVGLARAKAQNLILEEAQGDLLEALEVHLGLILEHFAEVDQSSVPSPVMVEAASSVIYAAPHIQSRDLHSVRDFLMQKLGPDFARSVVGNRDSHVSMRVVHILSTPSPTADSLNQYMFSIAKTYNIDWRPEPRPQDVLNAVSQILDKDSTPFVDLPLLRFLCSQGIPNDPPCLRPRIWKLFFGIVPTQKSMWDSELKKQRDSYYDLVRRLLDPFLEPTPITNPLSTNDGRLLDVSRRISRIPPNLFSALEGEPETSFLCPLDPTSPEDIKILCAGGLDSRLALINGDKQSTADTDGKPGNRLESNAEEIPAISLSTPGLPAVEGPGSNGTTTTLVSSRSYITGHAHSKHVSSLFRMLYLHQCINPGNNQSPHLPSLLVPLYSVMNQEVEPADLAHVESDTFWTFEAMIGEFSELEDEEGGSAWMRKLRERLIWADSELFDNLNLKGLDPGLPHYSYRWLAPILSQTLPVPAVVQVWDALFSRPQRERDSHPKLDYLIDFCTGMLVRARPALLRLGKPHHKKPSGLWTGEDDSVPPPSPMRAWELGDAFLEGMSLLQMYPIEAVGGIDRLMQTASDLSRRRELEAPKSQGDGIGFGALWKTSIWRGLTNQSVTPEDSPESDEDDSDSGSDAQGEHQDDGNETETPEKPGAAGITSYLATTVWRGITNQSAMDAPPSPSTSPSPLPPAKKPPLVTPPTSQTASSIWNYAEKLRDSDAAASLAKVSSNWRAKGLLGGWGTRSDDVTPMNSTPDAPLSTPVPASGRETDTASLNLNSFTRPNSDGGHQSSSPTHKRTDSGSPPRPLHFKNPRDSRMPQPRKAPMSPLYNPDQAHRSEGGFMDKAMDLQASLASLTSRSQSSTPIPKAAPRPLLLGTNRISVLGPSRSANSTPAPYPEKAQWADVQRAKARYVAQRESLSSVSSLSPSEASSSRVVPLNRRSVSPMYGGRNGPRSSVSSSGTASDRDVLSPSAYQPTNGRTFREFIDEKEYSTMIISKPAPKVPFSVSLIDPGPVYDIMIHETDDSSPPLPPAKKSSGKKTPPPSTVEDASDSSIMRTSMNRSPKLRSRRNPPKLANIRIQDGAHLGGPIAERIRPLNDTLAAPEGLDLQDSIPTPKGSGFVTGESPSPPGERQAQPRVRKTSTSSRTRKISDESRRKRRSAADEGDDEGYDDLLSAYESEEGSPMVIVN